MLADETPLVIDVVSGEPTVVQLSGELDGDSARSFRQAAQDLVAQGHRCIVLDCRNLRFCDSQGLHAMWELRQALQPEGSFTLRDPPDHLIRVLQVTDLAESFGVVAEKLDRGNRQRREVNHCDEHPV